MPQDNTLAETLGNLGSSLGQLWNPKTQMEARMLQQRMMLEQFELQQKQREVQARDAAIQTYGHLVPPDKLPLVANAIWHNTPPDKVLELAARLSDKLIDGNDDATWKHNADFIFRSTGQVWDKPYPPSAGPLSAKQSADLQAQQAGATTGAQKTAELGAVTAEKQKYVDQMKDVDTPAQQAENLRLNKLAGLPEPTGGIVNVGPVTQGAQQRAVSLQATMEAYGKTSGDVNAKQDAVNNLTKLFVDDPASEASNRRVASAIATVDPKAAPAQDQYTTAVGPATAAQRVKDITAGEGAKAGEEERQRLTAEQQLKPTPIAPGYYPRDVTGGAPTAGKVVTVPDPNTGLAPQVVARTVPDGKGGVATIVGPVQGAPEANTAQRTQLQQAIDEGYSASLLKSKLAQLRDLSVVANTQGFTGQVVAAATKRLADAGIVIGDTASAQKAMDQILNTEIPDMRRQSGIQRLAGPEIQAVGKQIGTAQLPTDVLNNIIANEEAMADLQIARRNNAQSVLGQTGSTPMPMNDYVQAENQQIAQLKDHANALRTQLGAIGAPRADVTASGAALPGGRYVLNEKGVLVDANSDEGKAILAAHETATTQPPAQPPVQTPQAPAPAAPSAAATLFNYLFGSSPGPAPAQSVVPPPPPPPPPGPSSAAATEGLF